MEFVSVKILMIPGSPDQKSAPSLRVFMTTLKRKLKQNSGSEQYEPAWATGSPRSGSERGQGRKRKAVFLSKLS